MRFARGTVSPNPVALNTASALTAAISDLTTGGSSVASASYIINGGNSPEMLLTPIGAVMTSASATVVPFTSTGVYSVCVRGLDQLGNTGAYECTPLPVYDPAGGFVTGGGWFNSPAGALTGTHLTGKANFGFVSKYQNGKSIPTGNTEFQFKAGNLNFKSTVYEWMVIAGARAQYKGSGKINGVGDYRFMLTAIDGQVGGGGGVDKIRIRIWDNSSGGLLLYDSQVNGPDSDDPTTVLGGGSIIIHK